MSKQNDSMESVFESRPTNELLWIYRENSVDWSPEELAEIKTILEKRGKLRIGASWGEDAGDDKRRHDLDLIRSTPVVAQATTRRFANASSLGDYRVYLWLFLMNFISFVILTLSTAYYVNTPIIYGIWIGLLPLVFYDSLMRYRAWRFLIHHSDMHGLAIKVNSPWQAVIGGSGIFSRAKPDYYQESFQNLVKHLQAEHAIGELKHPLPPSGLSAMAGFVQNIMKKQKVDTWPFFVINANIACRELNKQIRFLPREAPAIS